MIYLRRFWERFGSIKSLNYIAGVLFKRYIKLEKRVIELDTQVSKNNLMLGSQSYVTVDVLKVDYLKYI